MLGGQTGSPRSPESGQAALCCSAAGFRAFAFSSGRRPCRPCRAPQAAGSEHSVYLRIFFVARPSLVIDYESGRWGSTRPCNNILSPPRFRYDLRPRAMSCVGSSKERTRLHGGIELPGQSGVARPPRELPERVGRAGRGRAVARARCARWGRLWWRGGGPGIPSPDAPRSARVIENCNSEEECLSARRLRAP